MALLTIPYFAPVCGLTIVAADARQNVSYRCIWIGRQGLDLAPGKEARDRVQDERCIDHNREPVAETRFVQAKELVA